MAKSRASRAARLALPAHPPLSVKKHPGAAASPQTAPHGRNAPDESPQALYAKALTLLAQGLLDQAIAPLDRALRLQPHFPEALCSSGVILHKKGYGEQALRFYNQALLLDLSCVEAHFNRGNLLIDLGRYEEALASYDAAIALNPQAAIFLCNRGVALYQLARLEEAKDAYQKALALAPRLHQAALNLGNVEMRLQHPDRAIQAYESALAIKPDYAAAYCGKGIALKELAQYEAAALCFEQSLAIDPQSHDALGNQGALHLLLGDFDRGWAGYEYRWFSETMAQEERSFPLPVWEGPISRRPWASVPSQPARRIIIINDHALGDTLQFSRYLPLLTQAGLQASFACPPKLHRILSSLDADITFVDRPATPESYDAKIFLSSLPFAFATRETTIPAAQKYLGAEPALIEKWARRLGGEGFKIGVCWQGNMDFRVDRERSIPLNSLAPLAQIDNVRLISLQKGDAERDLSTVDFAARIETLGADFDAGPDAFIDTAAVMQSLDLIITCDTSLAHLAGALGRPVWVALKQAPEWRWMLERSDSPWYASMRLFRQERRGDWSGVVQRMTREAAHWAAQERDARGCADHYPQAPVSIGELMDKLSILEIKSERIRDARKLDNIRAELAALRQTRDALPIAPQKMRHLAEALKTINEALWRIEDEIRLCEKAGEFGPRFIALARAVYHKNDERAHLKRAMNFIANSALAEEKSYA